MMPQQIQNKPYELNVPSQSYPSKSKGKVYLFMGISFLAIVVVLGLFLLYNVPSAPVLPGEDSENFFQNPIDTVREPNGPQEIDYRLLSSNPSSRRQEVIEEEVNELEDPVVLASLASQGPIQWGNRPIVRQNIDEDNAPQLPSIGINSVPLIVILVVLLVVLYWAFSKKKTRRNRVIKKRKVVKRKKKK